MTNDKETMDLVRQLIGSMDDEYHGGETGREPGTFTTGEYASQVGLSNTAARGRIRKLKDAGLIKPVKVRKRNDWGNVISVNGWKVVKDE